MVEPSPAHPTIPPARARAFRDAVWRYSHWSGEREPEVILDLKPVLIRTVCKNVLPFNDPLPEDVFEKLFSELHMEHAVRQRLRAQPLCARYRRAPPRRDDILRIGMRDELMSGLHNGAHHVRHALAKDAAYHHACPAFRLVEHEDHSQEDQEMQ